MFKRVFLTIAFLLLVPVIALCSCFSDFDCGIGYKCVKAPFQTSGTCMKSVDEFGVPKYDLPRVESIFPRTEGDFDFDIDCPIGFYCDRYFKVCIKKR